MANEQEERSVSLPVEIIETVLSKLPVTSLLRFKSVSKSWNTIISDPLFVKNHRCFHGGSSNLQTIFLSHGRFSTRFDLVKFEDLRIRSVQQPLEAPPTCPYEMLCYCDGVILLTNYFYTQFMLWNPSNRRPKSFMSQYQYRIKSVLSYGLSHDPTVGHFKFVIIFMDYYLVFSDKHKGCTKKEFEEDHRGSEVVNRCGVSADGVVYWVTCRGNVREIIYFDPRDDKFKILDKPNNVRHSDDELFYLTELRGSLCMYRNGRDKTTVRILIKEKGRDNNSWKDLITIENVQTPISSFEPKYFVENKILILVKTSRLLGGSPCSSLVIYNPFEKTFEEVQFSEFDDLVPYIDNPSILSKW